MRLMSKIMRTLIQPVHVDHVEQVLDAAEVSKFIFLIDTFH